MYDLLSNVFGPGQHCENSDDPLYPLLSCGSLLLSSYHSIEVWSLCLPKRPTRRLIHIIPYYVTRDEGRATSKQAANHSYRKVK